MRFNCIVLFCIGCGVRKWVRIELCGLNLCDCLVLSYRSLFIIFRVVGWCVVNIVVCLVLDFVLIRLEIICIFLGGCVVKGLFKSNIVGVLQIVCVNVRWYCRVLGQVFKVVLILVKSFDLSCLIVFERFVFCVVFIIWDVFVFLWNLEIFCVMDFVKNVGWVVIN